MGHLHFQILEEMRLCILFNGNKIISTENNLLKIISFDKFFYVKIFLILFLLIPSLSFGLTFKDGKQVEEEDLSIELNNKDNNFQPDYPLELNWCNQIKSLVFVKFNQTIGFIMKRLMTKILRGLQKLQLCMLVKASLLAPQLILTVKFYGM